MNNQMPEKRLERRWGNTIAGGCLAVLFLALFIISTIFIRAKTAIKNSPTLTPTTVSTPHILAHQPANPIVVRYDDFSSNLLDWGLYYPYGKLEVINGKLILQSNVQGGFIIGTSRMFAPSGGRYYIQADFTTDTDIAYPYGLIFGLNRSLSTFYVFEVLPRAGGFRLLKSNAGNWDELVPYSQHAISPYPEVTTLSVYFDKGNIELYINGELASNFTDADFYQSTDIGIFVSNTGYRLIVDDFFIYDD